MSNSSSSVSVSKVTKKYGDFVAVGDLSFEVKTGTVYGILGPNGAGKTTTLRMINDILMPDTGEIRLLGDLRPGIEAAKRIGYLPEERGLYPKMKVTETLVFFGELRGLPRKRARKQAGLWLERLKIQDWHDNKVQDLSKGMQQKVQFAAALIHDPELLILDEPWSGLDPINAEVLKDIVVAQKDAGRTVLFSTHLMDQAEEICDSVCIMARGKLAIEGKLADLKRDAASEGVVQLAFTSDEEQTRALATVLVSEMVKIRTTTSAMVEVQLQDGHQSGELLAALVKESLQVRRFEHRSPSLHEIFVNTVGELAGTELAEREESRESRT